MMQKPRVQPRHIHWLGVVGSIMLAASPAVTLAQIAGDATLGTQVNGNLIAPCTGNCIITNGATRGSNLFHSFQQFSLPNGDFAGFVTTPAIQNVIVRVTGVGQPFISNINGTIATSNPANFFLLNPNGIIFGPGAALNIDGSFLATTANRMQFADGTEFRTTDPAPLLTVSVPAGLQFGQTSGAIRSELRIGAGINSFFTDFALVGGDITLDNSIIQAPGQRVELAGVGENGTVRLQLNGDRLSLSFAAGTPRRDITLTNGSVINATASIGGGEVVVAGRNIALGRSLILTGILPGIDNAATNQAGDITIDAAANLQLTQVSYIVNQLDSNATGQGGNIHIVASDIRMRDGSTIAAATFGNGNAGNVQVTANTIALDGASVIASEVGGTGSGRGGDVTVEAGSLNITNGAQVGANTIGNGNAGNVRVTANTIALDGTTPNGQFGSAIGSQVLNTGIEIGSGHGGDVTVQTDSLTVTNGASVSASTFGNGNAGNVRVTANTIALDGSEPNGQFVSEIASEVGAIGSGNGGDITVQTGSLTVTNGANVSAATFGNGNAGNVRVTANTIALDGTTPDGQFTGGIDSQVGRKATGRGGDITVVTGVLTITNGAGLDSNTLGNGDAGNVQVTADTIRLDGTSPNGRFISLIGSQVRPSGNGRGGDITVKADILAVSNGAAVSSSAIGNGSAGNLDITARTLQLNNGAITAIAFSGDGANIKLTIGDLLLMRHGSEISTSAGLARGGGNGGNITIAAPRGFLVTAPNENNDITANAFNGSGGKVTINAQGIYWFTPRSRAELAQLLGTNDPAQLDPRRLPTNDITAISQGNPNLSGTVNLNILNLDPSRGLVALPVNLTDPSQQISQSCTPGDKAAASSFVSTGRGGIPLNPDEPLESRAVVTQWVALPEEGAGKAEGAGGERHTSDDRPWRQAANKAPAPIVEAQGWVARADGTLVLIVASPTANPASVWTASVDCQAAQGR